MNYRLRVVHEVKTKHKVLAKYFHNSFQLQNEAVDVDIDEILDMDSDDIRRSHLFVSRFDLAKVSPIVQCHFFFLQSLLKTSSCKRSEKDIKVSYCNSLKTFSWASLVFLSLTTLEFLIDF